MGYQQYDDDDEPKLGSLMILSIGAIIIGLLFIVSGAIVTGIAYTEITPPNYDENYDRYIGSSVSRLIGPYLLVFGFVTIIGSSIMIGIKTMRHNQKYNAKMYLAANNDDHYNDA